MDQNNGQVSDILQNQADMNQKMLDSMTRMSDFFLLSNHSFSLIYDDFNFKGSRRAGSGWKVIGNEVEEIWTFFYSFAFSIYILWP